MTSDTSIRFLAPSKHWEAILAHPLMGGNGAGRAHTKETERIHFDTPDLDLARRQMSLYVASDPKGGRQILQMAADHIGWIVVAERTEAPLEGELPDLRALALDAAGGGSAADLLPVGASLVPTFSVRTRTVSRVIELADARAEVNLQHRELQAESKRAQFDELELRLLAGTPSALAELASRLQGDCRLRLPAEGLCGGQMLLQALRPPIENARPFTLHAGMTAEQAFSAVVGQCIKLYRLNEDGVRDGQDPESVHQARVALRQLSSACSVFAGAVPPRATDPLRAEVKWLARVLGEVRDWEVLRTETFAEAPHGTLDNVQLNAFDHALLTRIKAARERMRRALRSLRYAGLQTLLTRWAAGQPWRSQLGEEERRTLALPVRECADEELTRRRRRLLKRGNGLAEATAEQRHETRIAAKKLRYALDFFESLYPAKPAQAYSRTLRKVQNVLGALNDNRVARERLRQMAAIPMTGPHPPIRSVSLERYLASQEESMMDKLAAAWQRLKTAVPPVALREEA
jgi:triphosphatase